MGQYLELVDRDGLPAVRLIPTNDVETDMALRAEHTLELPMSESSSTMSSNETTAHSPTSTSSFETSSSNVTSSPNSTSSGTGEAFGTVYDKHKIEEEDTLNYVNLAESPRKVMTRGQRKVMQESMQNVHREDLALWGTLRHEQGLRKPGRLLPFGCKCFLMELFAGAAMVTALAASWGLPVGKPIDVNLDPLHDLLKPANREMIGKYIDDMDPFVLIAGPKCGPWSAWQHINASRSFEMEERIYGERRRWYPVFKWLIDVFKSRLRKGRHIMMEHPWTSAAWTIKCMEDFLHARPYHEETNEPVEVMKIDQCQYGLKDPQNGLLHQKSTGLLLSSHYMKQHLCRRCDHSHDHQQLEGRSRTRVAEQWPQELCHAIVLGAYEELMYGTLHQAFPVEEIFETHEEMGELDAVHSEQDLAPQTKKRRVDPQEIEREELILEQSVRENRTDQLVMAQEDKRRRGWLTLPKEKRLAIRRLHTMTGHCSTMALRRMLIASAADKDVVDAVKFFQCQVCKELQKDEQPRATKELRPSSQIHFNYELSADVFEIHDCLHHRHSVLSLVDLATHFHVAVRVGGGGTPSSKVCADALNHSWLSWAGAPTFFVADQGVHNRGKVAHLLTLLGTVIRQTGARAPHQLGVGERHGGLLKGIMKRAIHERQLHGAEDISALCSESARVKNLFMNQHGYSPSQWVMGFQPLDITSMANQDPEGHLGLHQSLVDAEEGAQDTFTRQLLVRQWAKEAFIKMDTCNKVRKAMLRKSTPLRGHVGTS